MYLCLFSVHLQALGQHLLSVPLHGPGQHLHVPPRLVHHVANAKPELAIHHSFNLYRLVVSPILSRCPPLTDNDFVHQLILLIGQVNHNAELEGAPEGHPEEKPYLPSLGWEESPILLNGWLDERRRLRSTSLGPNFTWLGGVRCYHRLAWRGYSVS